MNLKFVLKSFLYYLALFVSVSLVTAAAQFFIYTPNKTEIMLEWCLITGFLFGSLESVAVYIIISFINIKRTGLES